jgi:hypothetical protein
MAAVLKAAGVSYFVALMIPVTEVHGNVPDHGEIVSSAAL